MDTIFAQAVGKVTELPLNTHGITGEVLLEGSGRPDFPVVEFTAEKNTMIDEAVAEVERGDLIDQKAMKARSTKPQEKAHTHV